MGLDINAVVQRRDGDRWVTVVPPPDIVNEHGRFAFERRNRTLFDVFAGVGYGSYPPIVAPRGLPADAVVTVDPDQGPHIDGKWVGDHDHSWLTAAEIAGYDWWQASSSEVGKVAADDLRLDAWLPWLLSLADDPTDVRVVFGFDS